MQREREGWRVKESDRATTGDGGGMFEGRRLSLGGGDGVGETRGETEMDR